MKPTILDVNTSKCKGSNFDLESNRTYSHLSSGDFGPVLLWRWTSLLKLARHLSNLVAVLQKQLLFQVPLDTTLVDGLSAMLQLSKRRNGQCLKSNDLNLSILSILFHFVLHLPPKNRLLTLSRSPVFSSIRVFAKQEDQDQPPASPHLAVGRPWANNEKDCPVGQSQEILLTCSMSMCRTKPCERALDYFGFAIASDLFHRLQYRVHWESPQHKTLVASTKPKKNVSGVLLWNKDFGITLSESDGVHYNHLVCTSCSQKWLRKWAIWAM